MVRYCSVGGCLENTKKNKNRRFFSFPSDDLRCKYWLKAVGRMDLESKGVKILHRSYFVCELHFVESDCYKKYLRGDAVPTLFLPQPEDTSGKSKSTQTDEIMMCCSCESQISANNSQSSESAHTTKNVSENTPLKRNLSLELQTGTTKRRLLEPVTQKDINADKDKAEISTSSVKLEIDPLDYDDEPDHGPTGDNAHSFFGASNTVKKVLPSLPSDNLNDESNSRVSHSIDDMSSTSMSNNMRDDEFDTFGRHVANQLRHLPVTNALLCQNYINNYLTEERLKVVRGQNTSKTNVTSAPDSEVCVTKTNVTSASDSEVCVKIEFDPDHQ